MLLSAVSHFDRFIMSGKQLALTARTRGVGLFEVPSVDLSLAYLF